MCEATERLCRRTLTRGAARRGAGRGGVGTAGIVGTAMPAAGGRERADGDVERRARGKGRPLPSDDTCGSTPTISTAATLHALLRRVVFTCSRFRARARARTRLTLALLARARARTHLATHTYTHGGRTRVHAHADRVRTRGRTRGTRAAPCICSPHVYGCHAVDVIESRSCAREDERSERRRNNIEKRGICLSAHIAQRSREGGGGTASKFRAPEFRATCVEGSFPPRCPPGTDKPAESDR